MVGTYCAGVGSKAPPLAMPRLVSGMHDGSSVDIPVVGLIHGVTRLESQPQPGPLTYPGGVGRGMIGFSPLKSSLVPATA